ncbi:MAG: preprotein translocase subunit SecE [Anaerococcus sp.]|nr:preprotein translocase subunit SecE [Anaerococcus sp.]
MAKKKDSFFSGVTREFKKIQWPNGKSTVEYTSIVIGISAITAVAIWILDKIFQFLLQAIM